MSNQEYTAKGGTVFHVETFDNMTGGMRCVKLRYIGGEYWVPLADLVEFVQHVEAREILAALADVEGGKP